MNFFEQRKFTIKIYLYGYPKEKNKEKEYPVYARLTYLDEKTEISLRLKAKPSNWNIDHEMFNPLLKFNIYNNRKLEDAKTRFDEIFNELKKNGKEPSVKEIRKIFRGKVRQNSSIELLQFYDTHIEEKRQRTSEYVDGTISHYISARNLLRDYLVAKHNINFKITALSIKFIVGFEQYLMSTPIKSSNKPRERISANAILKKLIAVANDAVNKEVLEKYPFQGYRKKSEGPPAIVYLTNEEIKILKNHNLGGNKSLQRVRDFFLFSVYAAGLRWSDVSNLKPQNIRKDERGIYWYTIQTQKTKSFHEMPLMEPAVVILNRYREEAKSTNSALPNISCQKLNTYLQVISEIAGLNKKLTSKVARKTFASLAFEMGIDIYTVSKMLSHKNIRTTISHYTQLTKKKLVETVQHLNTAMA